MEPGYARQKGMFRKLTSKFVLNTPYSDKHCIISCLAQTRPTWPIASLPGTEPALVEKTQLKVGQSIDVILALKAAL